MTDRANFPSDFVWGAATSAYQIEGAVTEDGRGASIWDTFCATPGKIRTATPARSPATRTTATARTSRACRSSAWARTGSRLPGRGSCRRDGAARTRRGSISTTAWSTTFLPPASRPFVSLYHWDLPQALENAGGWPERATAEAFAEYVETVARRLGDRVGHWLTQNEPYCISWLGYGLGLHAPGPDRLRRRRRRRAPCPPRPWPGSRDPPTRESGRRGRHRARLVARLSSQRRPA